MACAREPERARASRERRIFLLAFGLGVLLTAPGSAVAKGQWCNDTSVAHRATLTLTRATVGGTPVVPLPSGPFDVSSDLVTDTVTAHLFCAECTEPSIVHEGLVRTP